MGNDDDGRLSHRLLKTIVLLIVVVALAALCVLATDVLFLAFASLLLAVLLNRPARWIARRTGWNYSLALGLLVLVIVLAFVGFSILFAAQVYQQGQQLADKLPKAWESFTQRVEQYPIGRQALDQLPQIGKALQQGQGWSSIGTVLSSTIGALFSLVVIFASGLYFAAQPEIYRRPILSLVPKPRRPRAGEVLDKIGHTLWHWLLGRMASMLLIGLLSAIALAILGIPMAIALGVLTGLLCFIPNVGPILSVIPPTLLALQQGTGTALAVLAIYAALQLVESYVVTPLIERRQVSLPPAVVILAQVLAGLLFGLLAVALIAPAIATLTVVVRELYVKDQLGGPAELTKLEPHNGF